MKKILAIFAALSLSAGVASAQSILDALKNAAGSVLGDAATEAASAATTAATNATGSEALGGLLGGLLGDLLNTVTYVSLPGTWTYYGVATAITSNNTYVSLASSAYKSKLDNKLNSWLAKIGIRQGSAKFTFKEDGTFSIDNGKKTIASGTYVAEKNNVVMKFGQVYNYLTLEGKLAYSTSGCQILCDADKFLAFIKKAVAVAGKIVDTSKIDPILAEVSGLQLGFTLTK